MGIVIYLVGVNMITVLVFGYDKKQAKLKGWRVREKHLMLLALLGGSPGALIAMKLFHHKTRHNKFRLGVPLILALQLLLAYLLLTGHGMEAVTSIIPLHR